MRCLETPLPDSRATVTTTAGGCFPPTITHTLTVVTCCAHSHGFRPSQLMNTTPKKIYIYITSHDENQSTLYTLAGMCIARHDTVRPSCLAATRYREQLKHPTRLLLTRYCSRRTYNEACPAPPHVRHPSKPPGTRSIFIASDCNHVSEVRKQARQVRARGPHGKYTMFRLDLS